MFSEIIRWNASDGRCQAVNHTGFYGIPRLLKVFTQVRETKREIHTQGQLKSFIFFYLVFGSTYFLFWTSK